jgi:hypothetical protein
MGSSREIEVSEDVVLTLEIDCAECERDGVIHEYEGEGKAMRCSRVTILGCRTVGPETVATAFGGSRRAETASDSSNLLASRSLGLSEPSAYRLATGDALHVLRLLRLVKNFARKHGLAVFDPQNGVISYPDDPPPQETKRPCWRLW